MSQVVGSCPLTGEPVLVRLAPRGRSQGEIHLTATHVGQHTAAWGSETITCVPLAQLSSASYVYHVRWAWLLAAAVALLVGLVLAYLEISEPGSDWGISATLSGLVSLLCVLAYFLSRSQQLVLASAAGRVALTLPGPRREEARAFVEHVLQAQLALLGARALEAEPLEPGPTLKDASDETAEE